MEPIPQPTDSVPKLHVLVVDDDASICSACAEIAAALGYAAQSTCKLVGARSLLRGHAADIVLLNLPPGDPESLEFVSEIRDLYRQTTIIGMTTSDLVNSAVEAMREGASDPAAIINVHHSFLPAFTGARPYHAAHARGVKLIGATSPYVTEILDDGPIIEQDVARISHRDQVDDLVARGRDLERLVLSRAVRWHLNRRILCYGNKTVVFD
jgi:CheY-like chemotaxis protein